MAVELEPAGQLAKLGQWVRGVVRATVKDPRTASRRGGLRIVGSGERHDGREKGMMGLAQAVGAQWDGNTSAARLSSDDGSEGGAGEPSGMGQEAKERMAMRRVISEGAGTVTKEDSRSMRSESSEGSAGDAAGGSPETGENSSVCSVHSEGGGKEGHPNLHSEGSDDGAEEGDAVGTEGQERGMEDLFSDEEDRETRSGPLSALCIGAPPTADVGRTKGTLRCISRRSSGTSSGFEVGKENVEGARTPVPLSPTASSTSSSWQWVQNMGRSRKVGSPSVGFSSFSKPSSSPSRRSFKSPGGHRGVDDGEKHGMPQVHSAVSEARSNGLLSEARGRLGSPSVPLPLEDNEVFPRAKAGEGRAKGRLHRSKSVPDLASSAAAAADAEDSGKPKAALRYAPAQKPNTTQSFLKRNISFQNISWAQLGAPMIARQSGSLTPDRKFRQQVSGKELLSAAAEAKLREERQRDAWLASLSSWKCSTGAVGRASLAVQRGEKGTLQDTVFAWEDVLGSGMLMAGLFDGHGTQGHLVARRARDTLPLLLLEHHHKETLQTHPYAQAWSPDMKLRAAWEEAHYKAYQGMDQEVKLHPMINPLMSGCTAVTATVLEGLTTIDESYRRRSIDTAAGVPAKAPRLLIVSNIGDSRCVMGVESETGDIIAEQVTVDHKPGKSSEKKRIRQAGGRVQAFPGDRDVVGPRLWLPNEDSPGLAVSRSFGDVIVKDYGLSAEPDVHVVELEQEHKFVILASDGVWDVLSNEDAVSAVARCKDASAAASKVVKAAMKGWRTKHRRMDVDDISVVVLFLRSQA